MSLEPYSIWDSQSTEGKKPKQMKTKESGWWDTLDRTHRQHSWPISRDCWSGWELYLVRFFYCPYRVPWHHPKIVIGRRTLNISGEFREFIPSAMLRHKFRLLSKVLFPCWWILQNEQFADHEFGEWSQSGRCCISSFPQSCNGVIRTTMEPSERRQSDKLVSQDHCTKPTKLVSFPYLLYRKVVLASFVMTFLVKGNAGEHLWDVGIFGKAPSAACGCSFRNRAWIISVRAKILRFR